MLRDVDYILTKIDWMRTEGIWPNGLRYLWTDAFGVVLYLSLYEERGEERWLMRPKNWSRKSTACRDDRVAIVSEKRKTGMVSIFIISPCSCSRSPDWAISSCTIERGELRSQRRSILPSSCPGAA
ncbi:hypothetical protein [Rhizobium terrae]|uniref:hypothetical protein n=1 Tax=Rhizobium terrae TaxID=2171756 RepID=UPI001D009803|nr:hypothetical protein [Rhizobium terrae]